MSKELDMKEVVTQGAARISAGGLRATEKAAPTTEDTEKAEVLAEEVEKAAPDAKPPEAPEAPEEKQVEKALGEADVEAIVTRALEKALAPLLAAVAPLAEVEKSLNAIDDKVDASLKHQAAATDAIVGLNEQQRGTREVVKSVQHEVETIGAQPAGRKSVDGEALRETEKAVTQPEVDLTKLREVTKSMDTAKALTVIKLARRGDTAAALERLSPAQRTALGQ